MDIKHVLVCNPLAPAYRKKEPVSVRETHTLGWFEIEGGTYEIGHQGDGFAFDNEGPAHQALVGDFSIASRAVTNAEYLDFIEDNGYRRAEFWHPDGWSAANGENWAAPLFWRENDNDGWDEFTFAGVGPIYPDAPVRTCQFLRGRRLCRLGRKTPADGTEIGNCGATIRVQRARRRRRKPAGKRVSAPDAVWRRRSAQAVTDDGRRLGMDTKRRRTLSGFRSSARRKLCDGARPCTGQLS